MTDRTGGPSCIMHHRLIMHMPHYCRRPDNYGEQHELGSEGGARNHERLQPQDLTLARSLRLRAEGLEKVVTSMLKSPPPIHPIDDHDTTPTSSPKPKPSKHPHTLPNGICLRLAFGTLFLARRNLQVPINVRDRPTSLHGMIACLGLIVAAAGSPKLHTITFCTESLFRSKGKSNAPGCHPTVFLSDAPSYNVFRIHRFIRPQVTRPDSRLGLMLRISGSPLRRVTKSGDDAGTFYNIPQPKVTTAVASRRRVADAKRELVRKSIGSGMKTLKELAVKD
ncbi:uncharacterized protein LACBIDRAFT_294759 [Laccaria bicolor S238N-H82]|uniref:Predicted protein n=1 Tax=Laccaria bicolor (strain S238N-H82 / ATCC MYA-4686) TaxID=486041 RepID=B0DHR0_LACBS|nr:uncharacterized protein LACBIDRAFT_294759 [Laccaria bicolor S238N-H82]EDR05771.1 predicted protein [Laccaria bicolor S238N-H82]|eukprot:XP_001883447.1 predicted protein [Laccaria bicolor S238N-H82]